jgi:hypothetical protein
LTKPKGLCPWAFSCPESGKQERNTTVNTTYITTTIPYVNAPPHIGFALELVQADALARYARLIGRRVRFQTGTDENAFKNVLSARERGIPTAEFVAGNTQAFRRLAAELLSSHDDFVRTTEPRHRHAVHQLWQRLAPGDVFEAEYQGLYCNGCEDFLLAKDLVDGRCPDHRTVPEEVTETNHFFRLSAYQDRLEQLIERDTIRIVPETRKNEVLSFIRGGRRLGRARAGRSGQGHLRVDRRFGELCLRSLPGRGHRPDTVLGRGDAQGPRHRQECVEVPRRLLARSPAVRRAAVARRDRRAWVPDH